MIAGGVAAGRIDVGVVGYELRRILGGFGVKEAVEAIKPAAERPAVERSGRAALGPRRDVPFPDHVIPGGMSSEHLGERACLPRDFAAISGIAAVEIGKAPDPDR